MGTPLPAGLLPEPAQLLGVDVPQSHAGRAGGAGVPAGGAQVEHDTVVGADDLDDPFGFSHFTYHLAKTVAAMAAVLGGLDVLAFSGGIGENREDVREAIAARLGFLGDFAVEVAPAREDVIIARHVRALLVQ